MNKIEVIDASDHVELGVADDVIGELRTRLEGRKADTHAGYEMVRAGIAEVTKYRTGVGRAGKELKAGALAFQKKVNVEVSRVTDLLLEIEMPLREEKDRVDKEAERLRNERAEEERIAIENKERAERELREAEEEAKREAEREARDAELALMAEERKGIEAERKRLEAEQKSQQEEIEKERQALANDRKKIEAEMLAIKEKARKEREAKLTLVKFVSSQEQADRQQAAEAEEVRRAEQQLAFVASEAERERIAEEQLPDREKLTDFARRIEAVVPPRLGTAWGNGVLAEMCEHLQRARDVAYHLPSDGQLTEDDLAAAAAAKTVSQQTPKES